VTERRCAWCKGEIPSTLRRDALCCSKRCRQARHRFTTAIGAPDHVVVGRPRRLAYADPPYPGKSALYYSDHPDYAGEVDHAELIAELAAFDAWALSTSASALPEILAMCPPGVRVAAWHRGPRVNTAATTPLNAWEPVIYAGMIASRPAENDTSLLTGATRRVDSLVFHAKPRTTDPARVIGSKPAAFARWIFDLLAATPDDEFVDLFPGSGGVARAWDTYLEASRLTTVEDDAS
jgi:hypothetical protein